MMFKKLIEEIKLNILGTFAPCLECNRKFTFKLVMYLKSNNKHTYLCRLCWMKRIEERLNQLEELLEL